MPEPVTLSTGDALAIRRLLWEVGSLDRVRHDLKVEALHWAAQLDAQAGMPAWPTAGDGAEEAVRFYEGVVEHIETELGRMRGDAG